MKISRPASWQERYSYSQTTIKTLFKIYCADGGQLPRTTLHHGNWWYSPMVYCHVGDKLVDLEWLSRTGDDYSLTLKGLELIKSHVFQYHTRNEATELWNRTKNPVPEECDRSIYKCDHERYSYWFAWEDMIPDVLNDDVGKDAKFQIGVNMCRYVCFLYAHQYMRVHDFKMGLSTEEFYELEFD